MTEAEGEGSWPDRSGALSSCCKVGAPRETRRRYAACLAVRRAAGMCSCAGDDGPSLVHAELECGSSTDMLVGRRRGEVPVRRVNAFEPGMDERRAGGGGVSAGESVNTVPD